MRGRRLLAEADVVVADRLAPRDVLAGLGPDVEVIDAGKAPHAQHLTQEQINTLLVERARAGQQVVRLKGGDPFVFGRGGEEALACVRAGVPFEVVPGVTSAMAVPACAGIPVTHRGITQDFAVVSAHLDPSHRARPWTGRRWRGPGTLVLLMAVARLPEVARELVKRGRDASTPAAVICDGTTERQQVLVSTLGQVAEDAAASGVRPPAVVVVGEVVRLREALGLADPRGTRWVRHEPPGAARGRARAATRRPTDGAVVAGAGPRPGIGASRCGSAFVQKRPAVAAEARGAAWRAPRRVVSAAALGGLSLSTDIAEAAGRAGVPVAPRSGPTPGSCPRWPTACARRGCRPGPRWCWRRPAPPDPRAAGDARNQAALLASHLQAPVRAAFASAARPAVGEAAADLAARTGGPVAVASYLLAPGVFAGRLRASGAAWVSAPLGDHPAVAGLILERFRSVAEQPLLAGSGSRR